MLTTEKILRYVSTSIVILTVIFSLFVVVKELLKPNDPFEKIVTEDCKGTFFTADNSILDESTLDNIDSMCIFVPDLSKEKSPFTEHIFKNGLLKNHGYLFFGEKGVLLIRNYIAYDLKQVSEILYNCISKKDCTLDNRLSKIKLTLTVKLIDQLGELHASITFEDEIFSQIVKNSKKLINEMVEIKNSDFSKLRMITLFHSRYAFIENKDPEYISSLLKRDIDGLYLKSRGAKIRLLPHEYNDKPVLVISRKGRQYGLERDEVKKEEATLYTYRTTQYAFENERASLWLGRYSASKADYTDILCSRMIAKQILNSINKNGIFYQETEISSGKQEQSDESLLVQMFASGALMNFGKIMNEEEYFDAAAEIINKILSRDHNNLSVLDKSILNILIQLCSESCEKTEIEPVSLDEAENYIIGNPVYTGLVIEGLPEKNDVATADLIRLSFNKFKELKKEDKVRYLGYLFSLNSKELPVSYSAVEKIMLETKDFIDSIKFEDKGFPDFKGGIGSNDRIYPGVLLTAVLARGLSNLVNLGIKDVFISDVEARTGNFLRFSMVTDDDYSYWGTPTAKTKVQGGLRSHLRSDKIRLVNSSVALLYFLDRIEAERDR
jgi:hypothetical protein